MLANILEHALWSLSGSSRRLHLPWWMYRPDWRAGYDRLLGGGQYCAPTGLDSPTSAFIVYSTVADGVSTVHFGWICSVHGTRLYGGCIHHAKNGIKATTNPSVLQRRSGMPFVLLIIIVIVHYRIRYLYGDGRCRYCSSLLPHLSIIYKGVSFKIYGDSPELYGSGIILFLILLLPRCHS